MVAALGQRTSARMQVVRTKYIHDPVRIAMDFRESLFAYLQSDPKAAKKAKNLPTLLAKKKPNLRERLALRMIENEAIRQLGYDPNGEAGGWAAVDWAAIFAAMLPILLKILLAILGA